MKIISNLTVKLKIDNTSAINLAKNPVCHGKSKHIETRFHFLRDQVNKRKLVLEYCPTEDQTSRCVHQGCVERSVSEAEKRNRNSVL
jgi:hypothetical protein